jgi:hypothetical protein
MSKKIQYNKELLEKLSLRDECIINFTKIEKYNREIKVDFTCKCGNTHNKTFKVIYKSGGFCKECTQKNTLNKKKETGIERLEVENPSQLQEVKDKNKKPSFNNHRVENSSQEVKDKIKETNFQNYAIKDPFDSNEVKKIYLIVPFENKDDAKKLGAKFDWDKKLWYCNNNNKNELLEKYKEYKLLNSIIGENREFNGSCLFIDLIPRTSWFNNVRSSIYNEDWLRIRKYIYQRVNYKCECCGLYCKNKIEYDEDDIEFDKDCDDGFDNYNSNEFNIKEELKKWNTIQLEAHERWSYDNINNIQKLERIIALCHRCHSVTHYGLTQLRGLSNQADKHLMKINKWSKEQILNHHKEQTNIWIERNKIKWNIDLSIITNSCIKLKQLS